MTFEAFSKPNLPEEIVRKLLLLIEEKKLHPGARLPSERELASQLQVSRGVNCCLTLGQSWTTAVSGAPRPYRLPGMLHHSSKQKPWVLSARG